MDPEQTYPATVPSCLSLDEAQDMVAGFVEAFHNQDVQALADGWTDDVVIRFADLPEIRGKRDAMEWVTSRFARQRGYRLVKTFQAVTGDVLGDSWVGTWEDAITGKKMQGKGMEFLTLRGGKIAVWEAVFNVWEQGAQGNTPVA
ncbi:MAG: nuclear transport factor 2 family protein [Desulfarculaceae bacterium]|nr:nuclear transport factor 2 family protein [Desulfarculaceae bacterium]MCF8049232.1 nuclear transport factor 2 family protein [Desulfarculaceae bacterium]MCF8066036.1 nuclear transport factor 2 family protein [Desulfarculaceae bacterium]MCF8097814.1 nuclear transport factor 2 family protein [Desulfarculaceae bacterium]MCF8123619.1 nuclear transport factor 2 family protein [Desulfarculaceae bacterium]